MALFTISDLHLSLNTDKSMEVFGGAWRNYVDKLENNWLKLVKEEDTVVIPGDISWETYLKDALWDFKFLDSLPGTKIISKGNHDYWFTTLSKINEFFEENNIFTIKILHNNFFAYKNTAICGTKGTDVSKIPQTDEAKKLENREAQRLEHSILKAKEAGYDEIFVFLHYPPVLKGGKYNNNIYSYIFDEYNVKKCFYGHLHTRTHSLAVTGKIDKTEYNLVSSDYLDFAPVKIL